jgi:NO-binding membrane sensor protein with MHYT domain
MAEALSRMQDEKGRNPRQMYQRWNYGLIAASIAISLLGAFTATQLMCQARDSHRFSTTLIWTMLGSLAFGFCSIWSLHEVAMLACELDLPIGIDVPLTILSSVLAVVFTFAALASDMLLDRYNRVRQKRRPRWKKERSRRASSNRPNSSTRDRELSEPLLSSIGEDEENQGRIEDLELAQPSHPSFDYRSSLDMDDNTVFGTDSQAESPSPAQPALEVDPAQPYLAVPPPNGKPSPGSPRNHSSPGPQPPTPPRPQCGSGSEASFSHMLRRTSSLRSASTQSFSFLENSSSSTLRPENLVGLHGVHRNGLSSTKNAVCVMGNALYTGCTRKNIIKGFLWSLAITSMHFVGLLALSIPEGYFALNPLLVFLAATISWAVCLVGCILMAQMETHLAQQFLFSVVATSGVTAMHFTGRSDPPLTYILG